MSIESWKLSTFQRERVLPKHTVSFLNFMTVSGSLALFVYAH